MNVSWLAWTWDDNVGQWFAIATGGESDMRTLARSLPVVTVAVPSSEQPYMRRVHPANTIADDEWASIKRRQAAHGVAIPAAEQLRVARAVWKTHTTGAWLWN